MLAPLFLLAEGTAQRIQLLNLILGTEAQEEVVGALEETEEVLPRNAVVMELLAKGITEGNIEEMARVMVQLLLVVVVELAL